MVIPWSQVALVCLPFLLLQFTLFLRWLYRRMRDDEIYRAFVRDMATNHLPHLYSAMRQIAGGQGIVLEEPPPIQFVELNGGRGARRERFSIFS